MSTTKRTTGVDLAHLTQSQVAWLVGKPASWLRERGHQFERSADGGYDGRKVFQTMAALLGTVVISDIDVAALAEYARDPANCEQCYRGRPCEFHNPE